MDQFPDSAADKRELAHCVGKILLSDRGRLESYPPLVITGIMRRLDYPQGWDRWALALYASAYDFQVYHSARGLELDYAALRRDMLLAINPQASELRRVPPERGYSPAPQRDSDLLDVVIDDSNWWSDDWSLIELFESWFK